MAKSRDLINREISWLSFNERVLQEAQCKEVPLLERLKFLAIFSNNLDEFFRVRVATQRRLMELHKGVKPYLSEKPKKTMARIQKIVQTNQDKFHKIYEDLKTELAEKGILIVDEKELCPEHQEYVLNLFRTQTANAIAPIMLKSLGKFPELVDMSIYLAVKMSKKLAPNTYEYALIEIPTSDTSRFVRLPSIEGKHYIIMLDDVIRFCLGEIFCAFNYDLFEAYTIKITRDAELDVDNDIAESLLEKIAKGVHNRRKGQPVRFLYDQDMPSDLLQFIESGLELDEDDNIIAGGRYHNFKDFMSFPNPGVEGLVNDPLPPVPIPRLEKATSFLKEVEKRDISLHFPYQSFTYYLQVLREAAIDPHVKSIKITLYRVADTSKVIRALINAARNGKMVTAIVELRARFDEGANINWSKRMEEAGVNVIFGVHGLKIHSKMTLISREEGGKITNYAILSTGNFHEGNASLYTDFNIITADRQITNEVAKVFTFLEFNYKSFSFKHLLVAPYNMRRKIYAHIDTEIANAKKKLPAYIFCKINHMVDEEVIRKLYQANNAGVKIKLVVRGICALVPGIKGISENIEAVSIVDRYLEHSRIFIFCNGGHERYYISSADWMTRNLDYRVEVAAPVYDKEIQNELKNIILLALKDNVKARILDEKLSNSFRSSKGRKRMQSQIEMHEYYKKNSK